MSIEFTLSYEGEDADNHEIDFYDVAQGLIGFQRSLAITSHLVLNNEVITQAPSLKNAKIYAAPPEEGSWTITAIIVGTLTGLYKVGTAPKDTPLGHIIHSAYDYIISESLGFNVDYNKTLVQQHEEFKELGISTPLIEQSKLDSVTEKCEAAIREMHRPIYAKETADSASITSKFNRVKKAVSVELDIDTYEYIHQTLREDKITKYSGKVSMYNINTFKGRMFVGEHNRPIPFELLDHARTIQNQVKITNSLSMNVKSRFTEGDINVAGYKLLSKSGRLKGILITQIE